MQKFAWNIIPCLGYDFLKNPDLSVNTVRVKPSNRGTKNSQKVYSFAQQTCYGLEIWIAPSLCCIPQISCSDFENYAFWLKKLPKSGGHIEFLEAKVSKSLHQIC